MLYLNLIPSNLWYLNLRKLLTDQAWKQLSNDIRAAQHWTCQACGISIRQLKSPKWFDCHEMWDFNEQTHEVSLLCLVCLCKKCHSATHFGYASIKQQDQVAFAHLCKVNHWDKESAQVYIEACFEQWSQRSQKTWTLEWTSIANWVPEPLLSQAKAAYLALPK